MSDLEQLAIERLKAASEMSLMAYQQPYNPKGFPEWCYGCGAKMDLEDDNGNQ